MSRKFRKTKASLENDVRHLHDAILEGERRNGNQSTQIRQLSSDVAELKQQILWHKQMNQRLIDAVVNFAGIKAGTL
jgi:hypothetical protein